MYVLKVDNIISMILFINIFLQVSRYSQPPKNFREKNHDIPELLSEHSASYTVESY